MSARWSLFWAFFNLGCAILNAATGKSRWVVMMSALISGAGFVIAWWQRTEVGRWT